MIFINFRLVSGNFVKKKKKHVRISFLKFVYVLGFCINALNFRLYELPSFGIFYFRSVFDFELKQLPVSFVTHF